MHLSKSQHSTVPFLPVDPMHAIITHISHINISDLQCLIQSIIYVDLLATTSDQLIVNKYSLKC